jgi:hypothetical protein
VGRIELSAEVRAIEGLIDSGQQGVASAKMREAQPQIGRGPLYRYLVCLYDSKFKLRADGDLLREVIELVGEQPDLMEATALLAELYARTGDETRADLFARLALESPSPSARARALEVLQAKANDGGEPPSSRVQEKAERPAGQRTTEPASGYTRAAAPAATAAEPTELDLWFESARRDLVHRRSPTYGMKTVDSIVEMLLDWGKTVAQGNSFISQQPLPLTRASLADVDEAMVTLRRQRGGRAAAKSDTSRTMAAAGFFLSVVLHELDATVIEIAPDDGGCKVVLPSGAGTRPLLITVAFAEGTGPSLTQSFDRLTTAQVLASSPPGSEGAPYQRHSTGRMALGAPARSVTPRSVTPASQRSLTPSMRSLTPGSTAAVDRREELALTRPEVENAPLRKLDTPTRRAEPPPMNLSAIATHLATSAGAQDITARSGAFLAPTPASVEALESYCTATRGEIGSAPERSVWIPSDEDEERIVEWGAFIGETLIAAYGGVWECDPNAPSDPRLFRVVCEERVVAWPVTQVYLRLKSGSRHNMMDFVAAVGRLLT